MLAAMCFLAFAVGWRAGCLAIESSELTLDVQRRTIELKREIDRLKETRRNGSQTNTGSDNTGLE